MIHKYPSWLFLGTIFTILGILLRAINTFVLRPSTTRLLNDWFGPPKESTEGVIRDIALQSDAIASRNITPPIWLGWFILCVGLVMLVHGLIRWKTRD